MPPANQEPKGWCSRGGDDFCSAAPWVVAQAGWDVLAGGGAEKPLCLG